MVQWTHDWYIRDKAWLGEKVDAMMQVTLTKGSDEAASVARGMQHTELIKESLWKWLDCVHISDRLLKRWSKTIQEAAADRPEMPVRVGTGLRGRRARVTRCSKRGSRRLEAVSGTSGASMRLGALLRGELARRALWQRGLLLALWERPLARRICSCGSACRPSVVSPPSSTAICASAAALQHGHTSDGKKPKDVSRARFLTDQINVFEQLAALG